MTTRNFRSEMVEHANKWYGVSVGDRVSTVDVISRDDAMKFVETEVK